MVVDDDEDWSDDPRRRSKDPCRLVLENLLSVDFGWGEVKLCNRIVVGREFKTGFGDRLDRSLVDRRLEEYRKNNLRVEAATLDPGIVSF